jgi:hypothetical protein
MRPPFLRRLAALFALLLTACSGAGDGAESPSGSAIPPQLSQWIDDHDLAQALGDALVPAHQEDGLLQQTFTNGELVFDPDAPEASMVHLAPLGRTLGLAEPPVPRPPDASARYFPETGHTAYTGFLEAYSGLGGEDIVGAPISEVHFEEGLIYQYFENLGLVREEAAPPSDVGLIAFGLASLEDGGRRTPAGALLPRDLRERPFAVFLDRYGGEAFFGRPLSDPYSTADGALEQIYERAVLWAPAGAARSAARLRPLGLALGAAEPPVEPSAQDGARYVASSGHSIDAAFASTYERIDGARILGLPLDEARLEDDVLRQRFENGILEYHADLPPTLAVQLAPLGRDYTAPSIPQGEEVVSTAPAPPASAVTGPAVRTWVAYPILDPGAEQQITIEVLQADGSPWGQVVPLVRIGSAQGSLYPSVPPTGPDGRSSFSLTLQGLQPGEIITYEVVVTGDHGTAYTIGQFAARLLAATP